MRYLNSDYLAQFKGKSDWQWFAFFLILVFPILGNSISYGWFETRRPLQFMFLSLGVGYFLWDVRWRDLVRIKPYVSRSFIVSLMVFAASGLFLIFTPLTRGEAGREPAVFEWISVQKLLFSFAFLWLFLTVARFLKVNKEPVKSAIGDKTPEKYSLGVSLFALLIGGIIVFKAWWVGPAELQAHVDFSGSTTIVGLCSTTAFFVILFSLPAPLWGRFVVSLPFIYLLFFSTSRTAYVVFFSFWFLFVLRSFYITFTSHNRMAFVRAVMISMVPLIALLTILAPLKLSSRFYPFYISKEAKEKVWTYNGRSALMKEVGPEMLVVYRQEELWNRMSRFIRAFYSAYQSPIVRDIREMINSLSNMNLMPDIFIGAEDYMVMGGHDPNDRWQRLAAQSTRQESRTQIIRKTNVLIRARKQGWWPRSYPRTISFYCNPQKKCQYPHNIFLETTYYFGVFMGFVYFLVMALLAWFLAKFAIASRDFLITGVSVSILVHFFGAQFTGTFYDLIVTGFLLIVLVVYLLRKIEEEDLSL